MVEVLVNHTWSKLILRVFIRYHSIIILVVEINWHSFIRDEISTVISAVICTFPEFANSIPFTYFVPSTSIFFILCEGIL